MTDLIADLRAAKEGNRKLSDRMLLARGWTSKLEPEWNDLHKVVWMPPPSTPKKWFGEGRPSPTESVDDALSMVPEGWHVEELSAGDPNTHVDSVCHYPRCVLVPNLNNDEGWIVGKREAKRASTPALAICIAALEAEQLGHQQSED